VVDEILCTIRILKKDSPLRPIVDVSSTLNITREPFDAYGQWKKTVGEGTIYLTVEISPTESYNIYYKHKYEHAVSVGPDGAVEARQEYCPWLRVNQFMYFPGCTENPKTKGIPWPIVRWLGDYPEYNLYARAAYDLDLKDENAILQVDCNW